MNFQMIAFAQFTKGSYPVVLRTHDVQEVINFLTVTSDASHYRAFLTVTTRMDSHTIAYIEAVVRMKTCYSRSLYMGSVPSERLEKQKRPRLVRDSERGSVQRMRSRGATSVFDLDRAPHLPTDEELNLLGEVRALDGLVM